MEFSGLGKMFVCMGLMLVAVGGLMMWAGRWPSSEGGFGWLGRLPGDLLVKRQNFSFYFPITTSILLSVVGSVLLYLFMRR